MTALAKTLARRAISAAALRRCIRQSGRRAGQPLSAAAMSRLINHDEWPVETAREAIEKQIGEFLTAQGVPAAEIEGLWAGGKTPDHGEQQRPGGKVGAKLTADTMLLPAQVLNKQARSQFGVNFNPFEGIPREESDFFLTDAMRSGLEAFEEAAALGAVRALAGRSGSGKTALKRLVRMRLARGARKTTIVETMVTTMSDNNRGSGSVMRTAQIHEAIIRELGGEAVRIPNASAKRQRLLRDLVRAEADAKRQVLLIIDEAHDLHPQTLAHLKRLHEFLDGAVGIMLLGQPLLAHKLTPRLNPGIEEAGQRFPVEWLPPLEPDEIKDYLDKRLFRAGSSFRAVFDADAPAAIAQHLTRNEQEGRGAARAISEAYPLAINNLAALAANYCASRGHERVSAATLAAALRGAAL